MPLAWSPRLEEYVRKAAAIWCRRLGITAEDAQDIAQDAVVSAWIRTENGKIRYKEGLWFLARNTAIDHRIRSRRYAAEPLDDELADRAQRVLDEMTISEIQAEFPELVLLASARADGFEWDMIAESLGESCGALRVRYSRLIRRAREHFGPAIEDFLRE